jgi:hypothetical protein
VRAEASAPARAGERIRLSIAYVDARAQDEARYRDLLRVVGACLDWQHGRCITVCETGEGMIWHCFSRGDLFRPISGIVPFDHLGQMLERLKQGRRDRRHVFGRRAAYHQPPAGASGKTACVDGYQETFRTVGARLDIAKASAVLIVEETDRLTVGYRFPVSGFLRRDLTRMEFSSCDHEDHYSRDQLREMVARDRGKRNSRYFV